MYGDSGRFAYHYTTANAAFAQIMHKRELRLSRLSEMRDPVENKDWVQVLFESPLWSEDDARNFEALTRQVIYDTKILSMTVDSPDEARRPEHARGYARPRMWEQYAENHQGVCLVFEHEDLRSQIEQEVARFRRAICGLVAYSDTPLAGHESARSLSIPVVAIDGHGDYKRGIEAHLDTHAQELFFRKLADWRTESEYRFVVVDSSSREIVINYGDTLRAVILGERFPAWQMPGAAEVCRRSGVDLRQIRWGPFPPGVFDP